VVPAADQRGEFHGPLAIEMPIDVDDAYQVFVDGQQIGEFGKFTKHGVTAYFAQPRAFRLPRKLRNGPMTIAVRMWMDSATPFNSQDSGGMHEPPVLGRVGVIMAFLVRDRSDTVQVVGSAFFELLFLLLAWTVAAMLLWMDRKEPAYLWMSLVCVVTIFSNGVTLIVTYHTWISQMPFVLLSDVISLPLRIGLWVIFWGYWFRIVRMDWVHRIVWGLALLLMIGTAMLRPPLYGEIVPVGARIYLFPILQTLKLALAALLFAITARGIRKQKTEGWLAFAAVLLVAVSLYQRELRVFLHVKTTFELLGFAIHLYHPFSLPHYSYAASALSANAAQEGAMEDGDRTGAAGTTRPDSGRIAEDSRVRD
jgi:hypothetical protein